MAVTKQFSLKARGEEYIEDMVDNAFDMADYLQTEVQARENFRLGNLLKI